ncbi:MAG TPA: tyrosine-type recombinase/integrase, partial [Candidatus Krumholzibacterium sp.]|nr:tyrosine-type recombinase/integrase [Candidatus Krumholzibacterium sp.]
MKVPKKVPKFLSAEEIGRVLAAAHPDVRPMLQLMIFTGLRKGEIRHLEWNDVDLDSRLLHVRPKETWSPKTDNSARTIPLCEPALEALHIAKARAEKKKLR